MASYNRVILMGNLTRDPELRYIPSGTAVVDIGLAVNDRVKRNNEWVEEVTFVDVTLWGRTAEVAGEYLSKGSSVLVEGRLKLDSWEDKEGQKRSKLKVVGDRMQMVGSKGGGGGSGGGGGGGGSGGSGSRPPAQQQSNNQYSQPEPAGQNYEQQSPAPPQDDDIPF